MKSYTISFLSKHSFENGTVTFSRDKRTPSEYLAHVKQNSRRPQNNYLEKRSDLVVIANDDDSIQRSSIRIKIVVALTPDVAIEYVTRDRSLDEFLNWVKSVDTDYTGTWFENILKT